MTDRELLEAAAKAAGIQHIEYTANYDGSAGLVMCDEVGRYRKNWSPLNDDGDALRLFAKMPFCTLYVSEIGVTVNLPRPEGRMLGLKCDEYADEYGGDINAATRRAIVRAAAEIGKGKK